MQIAIISGKGGTGKSSITAALATLQSNVMLVDCDVDAANLYLLFNPVCDEEFGFISGHKAVIDKTKCHNCGKCMAYCRFDAIEKKDGKIHIIETRCDGCLLCSRICPYEAITIVEENKSRMYAGYFQNGRMVYGRLAPGEENSGRLVNLVREKAKKIAVNEGIETIIIDGPPGIGCPVISTITGVDVVVIVTEPTLSGLHDLKRTLEITAGFESQTCVIINKSDINPDKTVELETYCQGKAIPVIGKLPFDPLMVEAMLNCQSVTDFAPDSVLSQELKKIYITLKQHKT
ncbi:MAG: ATP-binding protein [Massilibacteroides sp.]|nr:ATP-binding protein [Massilibacteroides sp.]MDD4115339.1 ATP-binding protein [Massilibacteroides sp.]